MEQRWEYQIATAQLRGRQRLEQPKEGAGRAVCKSLPGSSDLLLERGSGRKVPKLAAPPAAGSSTRNGRWSERDPWLCPCAQPCSPTPALGEKDSGCFAPLETRSVSAASVCSRTSTKPPTSSQKLVLFTAPGGSLCDCQSTSLKRRKANSSFKGLHR